MKGTVLPVRAMKGHAGPEVSLHLFVNTMLGRVRVHLHTSVDLPQRMNDGCRGQTRQLSLHGGCVRRVAGGIGYCGKQDGYWRARQTVLLVHADEKRQAFRVSCSDRMGCANAFRMGSSNSSNKKYCARASLAFVAENILSADNTH